MDINKQFVITINRELGSGGRTVGRILAQKLGVEFYDKTLIKALQEKYGLSVEKIESLKGKSNNWWSGVKNALFGSSERVNANDYHLALTPCHLTIVPDNPLPPTTKEMFRTETEILKGIADAESCVVAGRSGFYVFRDHPNHFSVLIQATMPFRIERVMRKQNMNEEEAVKTIERIDRMRENYVKEFTGTSRYDTRNYDLVITADGKTEEQIAELIMLHIQ